MVFEVVSAGRPKRGFLDGQKPEELSAKKVGCEFCPLDKVPGIRKIFGEVNGAEVFIWGMAPGQDENKEGKEFVGKAGKLLWQELERVGIKRPMCDVQNVVRCYPPDRVEIHSSPAGLSARSVQRRRHHPTKDEIHCCSKFTKAAIEKSRAKVHLVFGKVAAKNLLGEEFCEGKKQFWSEKLKADVLCVSHPAHFVYQGYSAGGAKAPNEKFKQWTEDFRRAASLLNARGQ
jgi:DNA polymerase